MAQQRGVMLPQPLLSPSSEAALGELAVMENYLLGVYLHPVLQQERCTALHLAVLGGAAESGPLRRCGCAVRVLVVVRLEQLALEELIHLKKTKGTYKILCLTSDQGWRISPIKGLICLEVYGAVGFSSLLWVGKGHCQGQ